MSIKEDTASPKHEDAASSLNGEGNGKSRILARQLARPLTAEEVDVVSGARRAAGGDLAGINMLVGGTCSAGTCCVPDCDD
jgi:hypothetical protein